MNQITSLSEICYLFIVINKTKTKYCFIVFCSHIAFEKAQSEASGLGIAVQQHLENVLEEIRREQNLENVSLLTRDLHVWPDFHGNRSPISDPNLKGSVFGLTMDSSVRNLSLIYLATLQAVAYGTKHIVRQMERYLLKYKDNLK